jgi:hypothetical protein
MRSSCSRLYSRSSPGGWVLLYFFSVDETVVRITEEHDVFEIVAQLLRQFLLAPRASGRVSDNVSRQALFIFFIVRSSLHNGLLQPRYSQRPPALSQTFHRVCLEMDVQDMDLLLQRG